MNPSTSSLTKAVPMKQLVCVGRAARVHCDRDQVTRPEFQADTPKATRGADLTRAIQAQKGEKTGSLSVASPSLMACNARIPAQRFAFATPCRLKSRPTAGARSGSRKYP